MSEPLTADEIKSKGVLTAFFSNPLVGIIGSIASVVGLILAVYFYNEGKEVPRLIYFVNPVKTSIVHTGQASRLSTSFDNKVIQSDVTAAQIAIWNQGKRTIKRDNVLKSLVLYTENGAPILEATIRKTSRDVTLLTLNTDEIQKGRVGLAWNILEQNDGGVIQLIYAGDANVSIGIEGTVEGQKQIEQITYSEKIKSPEEQYASLVSENRGGGLASLIGGASISILVIYFFVTIRRQRAAVQKKLSDLEQKYNIERTKKSVPRSEKIINAAIAIIMVATPLLMVGYGVFVLFSQNSVPPFGF